MGTVNATPLRGPFSKDFTLSRRQLAAAAAALVLTLPLTATAENHGPDANTVVATVNDTEITLGHVIALAERLPEQYKQLPPRTLYDGIVTQLVDQEVLAQSGGGEVTPRMQLMLENDRRGMLAARAASDIAEGTVTPQAVQAYYDAEYIQKTEGMVEWNASHILVKTEEEASAIVDELNAGADFAEMAREKSTGPSGPNGGALGWFGAGRMVPQFEEAVTDMEPGAISGPVETQFGWHVIRLNDRRALSAPPLDEVRDEIVGRLQEDAIRTAVGEAKANANVTFTSEEIDPALMFKSDLIGE